MKSSSLVQLAYFSYLQQLVSILQPCLVGNAASSNFWDKDSSILPADNGDAKRLRTFVDNDITWFLQVWSEGKRN